MQRNTGSDRQAGGRVEEEEEEEEEQLRRKSCKLVLPVFCVAVLFVCFL